MMLHRKLRWIIPIFGALVCLWMSSGLGGGFGERPLTQVFGALGQAREAKFSGSPLKQGFEQAAQATSMAQEASSAQDWDTVTQSWLDAIATLQSLPPEQPERAFIQRKIREYLQNLAHAQQQADLTSQPYVFPSLGSGVLDQQLRLYLSYIATVGPPDVLVVGSSRALQGIEPQILQQSLKAEGITAKVFNLSVNGATAQLVNFMLQSLLSPEQLPKLVIWGDGSRAFNSSRIDATFARVINSPGYQATQAGQKPALASDPQQTTVGQPSQINAYGFLPIAQAFDPETYYQSRSRVSGRYDGFYNPFSLTGLQDLSLGSLAAYLNRLKIDLVYVHLPLSQDYLDDYRLTRDRQFQQFLRTQSQLHSFTVIDLLTQWLEQDAYFADPSHLNQAGAIAIAQQLAQHPKILEALK